MVRKIAKGVGILLLVLLAVLAALCVSNRRAARAVWKNLTVTVYPIDEKTDNWQGGMTYEKVPYAAESENQYVDIYVPEGRDGKLPKLYVIIHGGGFISNDSRSRQAQLMYRYFRDHGYACASVNYRLAQEAGFPGALADCKCAIRFLRAHAAEYGYDAERIAVFGESAGGYLAVMCAVTNDSEFADIPFIGQDTAGDVSAGVDVLVDYYGHIEHQGDEEYWKEQGIPLILYKIANSWTLGDAAGGYESVHSFFFRKNMSEMTEEEKRVYDPYTYIAKNDLTGLSAWIIHGDCDITVPYEHSMNLSMALSEKLGADNVSFRLVRGMGHASDPLYSEEILDSLKQFLDQKL